MKIPFSKRLVIRLFGQKKTHTELEFKNIKTILIRPLGDAVGDAVINLAYAQQLKSIYPNLKLGVLVTPRNKAIFSYSPLIDELIDRKPINYLKQRKKWQLLLDFHEYLDSPSIIGSGILATESTMIFRKRSKKYYSMDNIRNYDFYCPYPADSHVADHLQTSIFGNYFSLPKIYPKLNIPQKKQNDVLPFWGQGKSAKIKIFLAPQGSIPQKCVPAEELADLLNRISPELRPNLRFLLCYGKAGADYYQKIKQLCAKDLDIGLSPKTNVAQYAALTASADLVIGVDSGTVHLACALSKPLLSFYVDHNLHTWGPLYRDNVPHFTAVAKATEYKRDSEEISWQTRGAFPIETAAEWLNRQIATLTAPSCPKPSP